jgi:ABC-2 type transport system ATP-binding protein
LIKINHVTKQFKDVLALDDVSLDIPGGRIALLGPNGAGKSTLIKIILGLIAPDSGNGKVLGHDLVEGAIEIRKRIGYMPEHDCLPEDMTGVNFVAIMGRLSGMPKTKAMERAHEVLYYLRLGDQRYRKIGTYSGGMKQKVKLAQAIVHDPDIVFMDEPTSGLDPISRNEMLDALRAMADQGHTNYILSTHLLHDVEQICDRVVMLSNGKIVVEDSLANLLVKGQTSITLRTLADPHKLSDLLFQHDFDSTVLGDEIVVTWNDPDDMNTIIRLMAEHGFPLRQISSRTRELDDVYLEILNRKRDSGQGGDSGNRVAGGNGGKIDAGEDKGAPRNIGESEERGGGGESGQF